MATSSTIIKQAAVGPGALVVLGRWEESGAGEEATTARQEQAREAERRLLAATAAQAQQVLDNAKRESDTIRQQAFEAGYEEGRVLARQETCELVNRVRAVAEQVQVDHEQALRVNESVVVELALAVASKLVERDLAADSSVILDIMDQAIASVDVGVVVRVRVAPEDLELVTQHWPMPADGQERFEVVSDSRVSRGGCIVDTQFGLVDGQSETRFAEVAHALRAVRGTGR